MCYNEYVRIPVERLLMTRDYNNNHPTTNDESDRRRLIELTEEKIKRLRVQYDERPSPSVLIELASAVQCRFSLRLAERFGAVEREEGVMPCTALTLLAA